MENPSSGEDLPVGEQQAGGTQRLEEEVRARTFSLHHVQQHLQTCCRGALELAGSFLGPRRRVSVKMQQSLKVQPQELFVPSLSQDRPQALLVDNGKEGTRLVALAPGAGNSAQLGKHPQPEEHRASW